MLVDYVRVYAATNGTACGGNALTNPGLEFNGVPKDYTHGEYGPDLVSDYALDFIQRKKSEPFFLYYPMMLTHAPYDATPDSADYFQSKSAGDGTW